MKLNFTLYIVYTTTNNGSNASTRILEFIGNVHDLESYNGIQNSVDMQQILFSTHWGHLSIIFMWLAGTLFHIGWTGNYSQFRVNPVLTIPISHPIWDPHFSTLGVNVSSQTTASFSGVYNYLLGVGFETEAQIYYAVIAIESLAILCLVLGRVHMETSSKLLLWLIGNSPTSSRANTNPTIALEPFRFVTTFMDSSGFRLNFHLGVLIGLTSLLWAGHIIHVALPVSRGSSFNDITTLDQFRDSQLLSSISTGSWHSLMLNNDAPNHIFGSSNGSGSSLMTFIGGLEASTSSLGLGDIAHHHVAIGILFIWAGHLYSSLYKAIGHRTYDILSVSAVNSGVFYILKSLHLQISLALIGLSVCTSIVSHQIYSQPSYPYLAYDYVTTTALYVHHNWIASFLMIGALAHSALYLIRDYVGVPYSNGDIFSRLLAHKAAILSHLSWCSLLLGFHTLGLYVHNDAVVAFGEPYKQILIEPVFAQYATQSFSNLSGSWFEPAVMYGKPYFAYSSLGPGDFLAYHAIALGLHVTSLILLKGALDSKGSSLMPDKAQFGYGFACDGPARGGTCDISSWDSFYLAFFWLLNSNSWLMFYFHWKHLLVWQGALVKFEESSTYLNGWFRDYLWFNSASLIRGYDPVGANDLSVWSWSFLAAHLCWATGFMFLISWRGYWQELIDSIVFMHLKTPFLFDIWDGQFYSPVALSIVQARFIGLVHFASGFIVTYAAFVLAASS